MGYALVRVITMMVGDIGFAETFQLLYETGQLQNSGLALTLVVVFVVVMNIAFANLLVGYIIAYNNIPIIQYTAYVRSKSVTCEMFDNIVV